MESHLLYPLRFNPILKRLVWGGTRLGTVLGKPLGMGEDYAESWEVADHRNDVSRVAEGPLAGTTLRTLLRERGPELLGPELGDLRQFPLLVKFLDAHQALSVQVHPNDETGRRLVDDNGKTEAWIIIHAEPGSLIYAGLRPGVSRESFAAALESGEVEALLHRFEPRAGDCVFIPAGTVHAIGAGTVLAEVQQMSDATFRVHDWGRVGPDDQPRPLHITQALESINFEAGPIEPASPPVEPVKGGIKEHLITCKHFSIERLRLFDVSSIRYSDRFTLLLCLGGSAVVRHRDASYPVSLGDTLLLAASLSPCSIVPTGGATILSCTIPLSLPSRRVRDRTLDIRPPSAKYVKT